MLKHKRSLIIFKKIQSYKASFQPQSYETRNQLQVQNLQKSHFYGDKWHAEQLLVQIRNLTNHMILRGN